MTPLTWTIHPAARARGRATAALAVIALAGFAAAEVVRGVAWGVVAVVFLTLSVSGFLWPTRYRLDAQGVEVRHLGGVRRRPWRDVRRVERIAGGVLLSPYARPTVRDRVRAIVLKTETDPTALLRQVERYRESL